MILIQLNTVCCYFCSASSGEDLRRFKEKFKLAAKSESDTDDVTESAIDSGVELMQQALVTSDEEWVEFLFLSNQASLRESILFYLCLCEPETR